MTELNLTDDQILQAKKLIGFLNSCALTSEEEKALRCRYLSTIELTSALEKLRRAGLLENIENVLLWVEELDRFNSDL